jgi:hypothetical protein
LKVNDENSRILIHYSEAWNRGSRSGSTPKCHGSGTLVHIYSHFGKSRYNMKIILRLRNCNCEKSQQKFHVKNLQIRENAYLLVTWRVVSSPPCWRVEDTSGLCVVVDPLLSVVAVSGHLIGLPLGKLVLSGSILCCPITFHFSLFCVFWLVVLRTHFHHSVTTWTCHSGFPLSLLLKDSPFSAVFTVSGSLFQHSTDLTANASAQSSSRRLRCKGLLSQDF